MIDRPVWIDSHRRGQWCVSLVFIRMPPTRQRCDKVEASWSQVRQLLMTFWWVWDLISLPRSRERIRIPFL